MAGCGSSSNENNSNRTVPLQFDIEWASISDPSATRATSLQASRAARSMKLTVDGGTKGAFTETFDRPTTAQFAEVLASPSPSSQRITTRSLVNLSGTLLGNSDNKFSVTVAFYSKTGASGELLSTYSTGEATVNSNGTYGILQLPGKKGNTLSVENGDFTSNLSSLTVSLAEGGNTIAQGIVKRVRVQLNGKDLERRAAKIISTAPGVVSVSNSDQESDTYLLTGLASGTATIKATIDGKTVESQEITVKEKVVVTGISSPEDGIPMIMGGTRQFAATVNTEASGETGAVKWKIDSQVPANIATIDQESGLLQATGVGTVVVKATSALDPDGWQSPSPKELEPNRSKTMPRLTKPFKIERDREVTIMPPKATVPASSDALPQPITFTVSTKDGAPVDLVLDGGTASGYLSDPSETGAGPIPKTAELKAKPSGKSYTYTAPKVGGIYTLRAINTNDPSKFVEIKITVEAANIGAVIQ